MGDKIATRQAYGKALAALADKYPELVVLDADLSGATMTKFFKDACPERFFDMGIAEANMVGTAVGLATCGFKPFANSFAIFSAGRAWEQVRNSVAYPQINVKVIGSHGGLSVGEDGATHQCIEDFAIMRAIPGMTVLCPCDVGGNQAEAAESLYNSDFSDSVCISAFHRADQRPGKSDLLYPAVLCCGIYRADYSAFSPGLRPADRFGRIYHHYTAVQSASSGGNRYRQWRCLLDHRLAAWQKHHHKPSFCN